MAFLIPILVGVANVMEIITFIQFIHEEAIQSANLGVYLAVRSKSYPAASRGLGLLRTTLIPHLKNVNDFAGYLDIMEEVLFAHKT